MKKIAILIIITNLMIACQEPKDSSNCHYSVKLKNNTNKVLYVFRGTDSIMLAGDFRNDPYFKPVPAFAGNGNREMGEIRFTGGGKPTCIEEVLEDDQILYLFVLDSASIAKKEWKEVLNNNLVERRIKKTLDELRKDNFTVEYN